MKDKTNAWEQGVTTEQLELIGCLIDKVEDFIAGDDSDEVFIYGERYDRLASEFKSVLKEFNT